MSGFTLFKHGQCPICNGASKGCRESKLSGLIFCRDTSANPTSYLWRGENKHGFGLWQSSSDAQVFSEEAREERERRRREYLAAEERRREQQIARQLPAVERDKWYTKLLERLTLNADDKQKLLERGFTEEQIIRDGYRSVTQWQKVGRDFPDNLPGVLGNGALNVSSDGILCPIRNHQGLIIGCQIRLHESTNGRYRWLTSGTEKNPKGATPHLDGELPIGVFEPEEFSGNSINDSIWVVEGTSFKPSLTRDKLSVPVIGAASGRFNTSPTASITAVEYLAEKYQTKTLTFAPDAGDVKNQNGVPERLRQQFEFFSSLGYECRIAWWNQFDKEKDCDIDELDDISKIEYVTLDKFLLIAKGHSKTKNQKTENQKTENQNTETTSKDEKLPQDWAWQQWLKSRKFTPTITVNQQEFDFGKIPKSNAIIAVKSGLGTGKTKAIIKQIKESRSRAIIIGYRNNLLYQTIARAKKENVEIVHISDAHVDIKNGNFLLVQDASINLALCLDSIHHIDGYFAGTDIYLDEVCSVLLHAVNGGTLGDNQAKVIKVLTRAIDVCNRVFLLDGNLADIHADFIAKLAPNKQVIKIENQRKIAPHTIKFVESVDLEGEIKKRDKSPLFKMMCDDNVNPWIVSDSKELTKVIDAISRQLGKTGLLLNAETAGEDFAKQFLEEPDYYIETIKPDYSVISPTAESGVSVTVKNYFTHKFSFFTGVLGTNSQHQMTGRLRDNSITHYVICPEKSQVRDRSNPKNYSVNTFKQILDDRIIQSALLATNDSGDFDRVKEIISKAISRNNDDWWNLACQLGALDNFEMDNLRKCLIHALTEAGHNVEVIELEIDGEFQSREKCARDEIQLQHAQELHAAVEYESLDKAKEVEKTNPRKDIQRRIEKTKLIDRLPGIQNSPIWSVEFIRDFYIKDKQYISKQERFWLLNNIEISKKRHEVDWFYKATKEDFFSASMKRNSHMTIWALKELNIMGLVGKQFHKNSPEVVRILELARIEEVRSALRIEPKPARTHGEERIGFIKTLLDLIGLKIKCVSRKLVDGIRYYIYEVNTEAMQCPERLAVLECVESKFTKWMQEKSQVNWNDAFKEKPSTEDAIATEKLAIEKLETVKNEVVATTSSAIATEEVDEWLEPEAIKHTAELLEACDNSEKLLDLRKFIPVQTLKAAVKQLTREVRDRIRQWTVEQNQEDFASS